MMANCDCCKLPNEVKRLSNGDYLCKGCFVYVKKILKGEISDENRRKNC